MEDKNILEVFSFSKIEPPKYQEVKGIDWIKYGENNDYPNLLIDLYQKSALHSSIIKSKINQIYSGGVEIIEKETKQTLEFLNNVNKDENFNDFLYKIISDYVIFGGFYVNFIKKVNESYSIYHIPFQYVRWGMLNQYDKPSSFYVSKDWTKIRQEKYKPIEYPVFDPTSNYKSSIMCVSDYKPGYILPLPNYNAAITSIMTDAEISNFHLSNISNGMAPGIMINYTNGIPTPDERRMIKSKLAKELTGTDNSGKFIVTWSEDKDRIPIITPIQASDLDKQFDILQKNVYQNIIVGHSVTSKMLYGLESEGGFGNGTELLNQFQINDYTVIKPIRNKIQSFIDKIVEINALNELKLKSQAPIEFTWSEDILKEIMTKDELRQKINLEPLENKILNNDTTNQ